MDVELSLPLADRTTLALGSQNVVNTLPDESPNARGVGERYSEYTPWGFNGGGGYYLRPRPIRLGQPGRQPRSQYRSSTVDWTVAGLTLRARRTASTNDQPVRRGRPVTDVGATLTALQAMDLAALRREWRRRHGTPPLRLSRDLLRRDLAYTLQENAYGGMSQVMRRRLRTLTTAFAETGRVASAHGPPVRRPFAQ